MFSSLVAKCSPLLWFIFVRYFGLRSFLPRHAMLFEKTGIQVSLSFSSGISFGSMSCVQTGSVVHGGLLLNPGLQCHFVAWQIYKNQKCMCWSVCLTDQIFPRKMPKMYSTPIDLRQDQKMWVLVRRPLVKKLNGSGCHSSPAFGTMGCFGLEVSAQRTCNSFTD